MEMEVEDLAMLVMTTVFTTRSCTLVSHVLLHLRAVVMDPTMSDDALESEV